MASKGDTCSLSHFFLIMLPTRNFKLPFVLQICEILISKTWVSPTHHLTFKKKKKERKNLTAHYTPGHVHTIRPLSFKEKHHFQQSQLPEAKGTDIQKLI